MQHLTRDHCRYWGEPANKPPQGSLVARYGTCPVKMANKNEKSGGFWGLKVVVYKYVLFMYYGIYIFFWFPGWFSPRLTWNKKMNEHVTLQKEFPFPGSMLDLRGVPHGPLLGDVKYVSFASRWRFGRFACRTIGVLTFLLYWLLILFVYVHYLYNVFRTIINVCQKSVVSIIYIYRFLSLWWAVPFQWHIFKKLHAFMTNQRWKIPSDPSRVWIFTSLPFAQKRERPFAIKQECYTLAMVWV